MTIHVNTKKQIMRGFGMENSTCLARAVLSYDAIKRWVRGWDGSHSKRRLRGRQQYRHCEDPCLTARYKDKIRDCSDLQQDRCAMRCDSLFAVRGLHPQFLTCALLSGQRLEAVNIGRGTNTSVQEESECNKMLRDFPSKFAGSILYFIITCRYQILNGHLGTYRLMNARTPGLGLVPSQLKFCVPYILTQLHL